MSTKQGERKKIVLTVGIKDTIPEEGVRYIVEQRPWNDLSV